MSATARLVKREAGAPPAKAPEAREEKRATAEAGAAKVEAAPAAGPAKDDAAEAPAGRARKVIAYRGLCIYCGERIEIAVEKREISTFAFCNAECRARFDAEMNEALD